MNFNDYVVPDAVVLSDDLVEESNGTGTTVFSSSGLPLPIQRLDDQVSHLALSQGHWRPFSARV